VEQRLSLITLGVADSERAQAFYEAVGWSATAVAGEGANRVVFFQTGSMIVGLWDRAKLAEDSGVSDAGGWGGVTLAYNVRSPSQVNEVLSAAEEAGATIARSGAKTSWGGYSGVFIDHDGHPWEVAHNPAWTIGEDGSTTII
jgi:hypothetical protein